MLWLAGSVSMLGYSFIPFPVIKVIATLDPQLPWPSCRSLYHPVLHPCTLEESDGLHCWYMLIIFWPLLSCRKGLLCTSCRFLLIRILRACLQSPQIKAQASTSLHWTLSSLWVWKRLRVELEIRNVRKAKWKRKTKLIPKQVPNVL